jgi:hypothetical protein
VEKTEGREKEDKKQQTNKRIFFSRLDTLSNVFVNKARFE